MEVEVLGSHCETGPCSGSLAGRIRGGMSLIGDSEDEVLEMLMRVGFAGKKNRMEARGGIQKERRKVVFGSSVKKVGISTAGAVRGGKLHWMFLSNSLLFLRTEVLSEARSLGFFETVRNFSAGESGMVEESPASGRHLCGQMLRVTTEEMRNLDQKLSKCRRIVIETQSLMEQSFVVKAFAYIQSDTMTM